MNFSQRRLIARPLFGNAKKIEFCVSQRERVAEATGAFKGPTFGFGGKESVQIISGEKKES